MEKLISHRDAATKTLYINSFDIKILNTVALIGLISATTLLIFTPDMQSFMKQFDAVIYHQAGYIALLLSSLFVWYLSHKKRYQLAKISTVLLFSISLFVADFSTVDTSLGFLCLGMLSIIFFKKKMQQIISVSIAIPLFIFTYFDLFALQSATVFNIIDLIYFLGLLFFFSITTFLFDHLLSEKRNLSAQLSETLQHQFFLENSFAHQKQNEIQKNQHFCQVANEYKRTLNTIKKLTSVLLNNNAQSEEVLQKLAIIHRKTIHLNQLAYQVSDKLNKKPHEIPLEITNFKMVELIDTVFEMLNPIAHNRSIYLKKPSFIPDVKITTDAEKLFITLKTILLAAIKNSPKECQVSMHILDLGDSMQIIIQDAGSPLNNQKINGMFASYFDTKINNTSLQEYYFDLGLCSEYLKLLGGLLDIKSQKEKGNSFVMTFLKKSITPAVNILKDFSFETFSTYPPLQKSTITKNGQLIPKKHIVIVEKDLAFCEDLKTVLGKKYQMSFFENTVDAINFINGHQPDLIMSALELDEIDGVNFLKKIKEQTKNIPTIITTSQENLSANIEALRFGANDYLVKPFDAETFKAHIHQLIHAKTLQESEFIKNEEKTNGVMTPKGVSHSVYTNIIKEDIELSAGDKEWLKQFRLTVNELSDDVNLNLDKIASEMTISTTHLNRKVNALLGISPLRFVKEMRLKKAMEMLEQGKFRSVKAVAYSVGFKSEKVFSRNFRVRFGKNPSKYLN